MKNKTLLTALAALTVSGAAAIGLTMTGCGHTHKYSEDWKSDANGHWHYAVCDDLKEGDKDYKSDYAEHVYGGDDECDVCHYTKTPAKTEYTVTLDVNGGTLSGATTLTTVNGKIASLPTPTAPAGSTFDGWYTAKENGQKITADYKFTGNVTIYALYKTAEVSVTLNKETLTLDIANLEYQLSATVSSGAEVSWSSDNEAVVIVNEETGYIEALKPGAATVTATVAGGTASASCEIVVEDAYYLIGGEDSKWNKAAVFGQAGVVYFMPTETDGIYKTGSIELSAMSNFQVAKVGITSDDWWKSAFNGDFIKEGDEVLSKNAGNNIAVQKHGKYTVTLDLTGDKAVVSGFCDEVIDDGDVEYVYYLIGGMNNWTTADTVEAAGEYAFTNNEDGTCSLTVDLTKGWEFKVVVVGMQYNVEYGESAIPRNLIGNNGSATIDTEYKLTWTSSSNIGVGLSGSYTFTFNPDGEKNNQLSYTFTATEDTETTIEETVLHYYIKGAKITTWENKTTEEYELKETEAGSGIYTLTIDMVAADEFMFYSMNVGVETGNMTTGDKYIQAKDLAEGVTCVTKGATNLNTVAAGTYTFTYSAETGLNVTFTAATEE